METTKKGGIALHWLMLAGFVIGLAGGLWANFACSPRRTGGPW